MASKWTTNFRTWNVQRIKQNIASELDVDMVDNVFENDQKLNWFNSQAVSFYVVKGVKEAGAKKYFKKRERIREYICMCLLWE